MTLSLRQYLYIAIVISLLGLGGWLGYSFVQGKLHRAEQQRQEERIAQLQSMQRMFQQAIADGNARAREDYEAALQASEQRQSQRIRSAVRQASLEASTRQPGNYLECRLEPGDLEILREALAD